MRWTIVGLVLVGIIAAAAAAILVVTLKASGGGGRTQEERDNELIRILVSAKDIPARSIVEGSSVATKEIRRGSAPVNYLTDQVQAVGQVLVQPVKSGEAFTKASFATAENPVQLSRSLIPGHRIMSIVPDDTGIDQLLYPGCLVDVIGSFRVPRGMTEEDGEVLSVTLLQGIPVMAVGPKTIVSAPEGSTPSAGPGDASGRRSRIVALDVNVKQAEVLQLASKYGSISLSLRNPLDAEIAQTSGTLMGEFFKDLERNIEELTAPSDPTAPLMPPDISGIVTGAGNNNGGATTQGAVPPLGSGRKSTLYHTTTILRGREVETQKFPVGPSGDNQE